MILQLYIAKQYLQSLIIVFMVIIGIVYLVDCAELFRRAASVETASTLAVFYLGMLHLPTIIEAVLPIILIFSGVIAFFKMTKNLTLVIAKSIGLSFWQILSPLWVIAITFGLSITFVVSEIGSYALNIYNQKEIEILGTKQSQSSPFYFSDQLEDRRLAILAAASSPLDGILRNVVIIEMSNNDEFLTHYASTQMTLLKGQWHLNDVSKRNDTGIIETFETLTLPTNLAQEELTTRLTRPELLSFRELPFRINQAKKLGVKSEPYEMRYLFLLSLPFLFVSLITLSANFSKSLSRNSSTIKSFIFAIVTAFVVFISIDMINDLGAAGWVPTWISAVTPTAIIFLMSFLRLLLTEEG